MKLPDFKPSKRFVEGIDRPCLVAKVRNSELPKIATRHISRFKTNPICTIYLRGLDPRKISAWQGEMLEKLFEKEGLADAVEEGMREYETSSKWGGSGYANLTKRERREVEHYGIAQYITISEIVIDEIKREVVFNARTELDNNLIEHGISIYLQDGRWRFGDADYLIAYENAIEAEDFKKREAGAEKEWEVLFPPAKRGTPVETDRTFLFGKWKYDERESGRVLKQLGWLPDEIRVFLFRGGGMIYEFSSRVLRVSNPRHGVSVEFSLLGCERRRERVTLRIQEFGKPSITTDEYYHKDNLLIDREGRVLRRVTNQNYS